MNHGTVNEAELFAYLQPMLTFMANKSNDANFHRVHIITDSSYVAGFVNSTTKPTANSALWAAFNECRRCGLILKGHWLERDTLATNSFADKLSKISRLRLQAGSVTDEVSESLGFSYEDLNL